MSGAAQRLAELARAHWGAAALAAAVELDLFTALDEAGGTVEELAARLDASARGLRSLLVGLAGLGLVARAGERWVAVEDAAAVLSRRRPTWRGGSFLHAARSLGDWARLVESVRTGLPVARDPARDEPARRREFQLAMHHNKIDEADALVAGLDLDGVRRIADVGGGPGTIAAALLRRLPDAEATVIDVADSLAVARELHPADDPVGARLHLREADFLHDPIGAGYDLAVVSSVVHIYGAEENRALLERIAAALAPGGRVALRDFFVDDPAAVAEFAGLFDLNMLLHTATGRVYTVAEIAALLRAAGFAPPRAVAAGRGQATWLVAPRADDRGAAPAG